MTLILTYVAGGSHFVLHQTDGRLATHAQVTAALSLLNAQGRMH